MTTYEMFSEVYNKNAEKLERVRALAEIARKNGNRDLERKYRAQYTELKAEIDVYALQMIK